MRIRFVASIFIFLFCYEVIYSQVPTSTEIKVEVSKEKTVINNITYYLHTVKQGENIYRISLAYGVKQKDIVLANPEVISGIIKVGQILKIPVNPDSVKNIQNIESDNFIYHIVEEHQTLFFITQRYNITKEELIKYNPEIEFSPLQIGQVVRIPKKQDVSPEAETFHPIEKYVDHKVRRRETKYSISQKYNITIDEIIAANPILNTEDLKSGSIIKIPVKSEIQISTALLLAKRDSVLALKADSVIILPCDTTYIPFSDEFKIALLLPFSIEDNDTRAILDSIAAAKNPDKQAPNTELLPRTVFSLEFYEGFLAALDSLKRLGLSATIYTYDTGRDLNKLNKIMAKPEILLMDLIIGPFFTEGVEKVNQFSLTNKIKFVSPIIYSDSVALNPYSFQVMPGERVSFNYILNNLDTLQEKNIILVLNPDQEEKQTNEIYKMCLNDKFPGKFKIFENATKFDNLTDLFKDSVENIVFVPSSDETYVLPLFSRLSLDSKKFIIKVYGGSLCSRLRNVDQEYFHNIQFHFSTPYYADYQSWKVKKFVQLFRRKYHFEPQDFQKEGINFAFIGYDIGKYFLFALANNGKNFQFCLENIDIPLLYSWFNFKQIFPEGGYINTGLKTMHFTKDYYLQKID